LIDLGNSSMKWAWSSGGELTPVQSAQHRDASVTTVAQEYWQDRSRPERIVVASVASPETKESLRDWLLQQWRCEPTFVQATAQELGVTNAYSNPSELGVDRWLTLLAVHHQISAPVCVVDCGTAITIDLITADGVHLGGMILPGFGMMRQSLLEQTAIPPVDTVEPSDWLASDTAGAVAVGGVSAVAALVDRVLEQSQQRLEVTPELVLTGSDTGSIQGRLRSPGRIEPDLVIQGLALLANSYNDD
jgi:type III pantothenate kinase